MDHGIPTEDLPCALEFGKYWLLYLKSNIEKHEFDS